jgi:hypothetical protein
MALVGQKPAGDDRRIDYERHPNLCPPWRPETISSSVMRGIVLRNFSMSAIARSTSAWRTSASGTWGDRLAVLGDDERLAALDVVDPASQMGLGFGRLDFTHRAS